MAAHKEVALCLLWLACSHYCVSVWLLGRGQLFLLGSARGQLVLLGLALNKLQEQCITSIDY